METFQELRTKSKEFEEFVEQNKNTPQRLKVTNYEDLQKYYEKSSQYIINELIQYSFETISRVIKQNKILIEPNATLIMNSSSREQNTLISMFNKDLSENKFQNTIFERGIFLPSSMSPFIENPGNYLYINEIPSKEDRLNGKMSIRFLFDKNDLITNQALNASLREDLKGFLLQKDFLTEEQYLLIKQYFLKTAPFVLNNIIEKLKTEYINAKRENLPVMVSTPFVNTGNDTSIVIVLEALYNDLLKQESFADTILSNAIISATKGYTKSYNETLTSPLDKTKPTRQYNLRLILNTHDIEKY